MNKELIIELFNKFQDACYIYESVECWSARELQEILGYSDWRNFMNVIDKAKISCQKSGEKTEDHFVGVNRMVDIGSGAERQIDDIALTRYSCYLIAQNGNPSKPEIAFAQTYFAVQTRKQETIEKRLLEIDRVSAREKLSRSENKLSGIIYERGVDERGFAIIRSHGDQALFGGYSTLEMKDILRIPSSRPLADFLPTLTIKAKDFATELTSHNVTEKDLWGEVKIKEEHIENNKAVRKMLLKRGVRPETLPPNEDVKKVKNRLHSDEKKILKQVKSKKKRQ